ncbi:MAG: GTPase Era [Wenzhouxiangellaceae bacterium]|nr:GTPase Era [Wenzhouxiangellaceae bacterium]
MNVPSGSSDSFRCGTVVLFGRPNVGKSTLLNRLVGEHLSIVTHKPQTTRHRVTGIVNRPGGQLVLVDTPGLHRRRTHALNRHLNRVAAESLRGVDLVALMVDAARPSEEDRDAARAAAQSGTPVVLVLNKIDRLAGREALLPLASDWSERSGAREVFFIAARSGDGVEALADGLVRHLPPAPALFGDDEFTTESARFLACETVREQLLAQLHQEVPYGATVLIDDWQEADDGRLRITATILVAETRHKGIVIGQGGQTLKRIGSRARQAMMALFGQSVHLELHVRAEPGWLNRERDLARFGYTR